MGENSLYIYLLHLPLECSVGCLLFYHFYMLSENYVLVAFMTLMVVLGTSLVVSLCLKKVFVPVWNRVVKYIVHFIV